MSLKNLSATIKIPKVLKNKLKNKKINEIYKLFEHSINFKDDFIVAVSGGPDSLALAYFSKIYSIKKRLVSKFFIIDHKLRSESTIEAKKVKNILKNFSINAEILTWHGIKPKKNIQSLARKKRYDLLFDQCKKFKINNILLGHHQNDLIENFFLRICRGSGLRGLVSFDKENSTSDVNLLRPLLGVKKEELIFVSKYVFNFYINDPSNIDEKFQRIKIRRLIQELKIEGLDNDKFIKTIKNLKDSNHVVNFYVTKNLQDNIFLSSSKNKIIINNNFFKQPYEIVFRSFSEALKIMGKKYYYVRGKKLDKIIKELTKNKIFKATLGGCIIKKVNQTVIISKEH